MSTTSMKMFYLYKYICTIHWWYNYLIIRSRNENIRYYIRYINRATGRQMGFLSRGRRQDNRNNFNLSFNPAILNLRPTKCYVAQKVSDSLSQYKKNIIFQKNIKFSTSNYCVRDDKLCAVPTRLHADFDKYDYLFGISILEFLSFFNLLCIHRQ